MKFKEYLLKDIATITMGQSPKSQFYNEDGKGIEFLQGVRTFGEDFPYFDTYTTKYNRLAHENSILFSVRAPVGRVNWATKNIAIGRGVASISVRDMAYDRYVYYYFKKMGSLYEKKATGTVFTSITKKELESLKIRIPASYDDQKMIADRLAILDRKIHLNQQLNDNLVIIADGNAKQYTLDENGYENVLQILHTGDYIGEDWLFGQKNINNYLEATEHSEICLLKRQDLLKLLHKQPELSIRLLELNIVKVSEMQKQIHLLALPKVEDRLLKYLQTYADEIGKNNFTLPLKMKDLALYLGTTPETLSRKFALLEKQGQLKRQLRRIELFEN